MTFFSHLHIFNGINILLYYHRSDCSCSLSDCALSGLQRPGLCHLCCQVRAPLKHILNLPVVVSDIDVLLRGPIGPLFWRKM